MIKRLSTFILSLTLAFIAASCNDLEVDEQAITDASLDIQLFVVKGGKETSLGPTPITEGGEERKVYYFNEGDNIVMRITPRGELRTAMCITAQSKKAETDDETTLLNAQEQKEKDKNKLTKEFKLDGLQENQLIIVKGEIVYSKLGARAISDYQKSTYNCEARFTLRTRQQETE